MFFFFFSSRRRHTRWNCDWSSDVCSSDLELQGALVLQNKQCRTCHSLGGEGGQRGPALDGIATRQTRDQLIRQVLQGGGNMPAYGKNLSPAEVNALVAFMETLRPSNQAPARAPEGA